MTTVLYIVNVYRLIPVFLEILEMHATLLSSNVSLTNSFVFIPINWIHLKVIGMRDKTEMFERFF